VATRVNLAYELTEFAANVMNDCELTNLQYLGLALLRNDRTAVAMLLDEFGDEFAEEMKQPITGDRLLSIGFELDRGTDYVKRFDDVIEIDRYSIGVGYRFDSPVGRRLYATVFWPLDSDWQIPVSTMRDLKVVLDAAKLAAGKPTQASDQPDPRTEVARDGVPGA